MTLLKDKKIVQFNFDCLEKTLLIGEEVEKRGTLDCI